MPENLDCEKFISQVIREEPPSQLLDDHLKKCNECRQIHNLIPLIELNTSLYSNKKFDTLKKKILRDYDLEFSKNNNFFWNWKNFSIAVALAACFIFLIFRVTINPPDKTNQEPTFQVHYKNHVVQYPLRQQFVWESDKASVKLPDGSNLEIEGKVSFKVFERGLEIASGRFTIFVAEGKDVFRVSTPHGKIEVLGTVFTCHIDELTTKVAVQKGKVLIIPNGREPEILIAGQAAEMVSSSKNLEDKNSKLVPINTSKEYDPNKSR